MTAVVIHGGGGENGIKDGGVGTLLRRGSTEGKMKKKRKGNLCQMPHPGISETGGFPNLTRYLNEIQSHVLPIFLLTSFQNGHRHKSSAKFPTFHKVKC